MVPVEELRGDVSVDALNTQLRALLRAYRRTLQSDRAHLLEQFRFVHLARKVVGVGSVGARRGRGGQGRRREEGLRR